jgi:hypothetical protein
VNQEAPLHVTVLVRAIDAGSRVDRVWRLSQHLSLTSLRLRRDLPFEPGRPVALTLALPDDDVDRSLHLTGIVRQVTPARHEQDELEEAGLDPREPRPRAVELIDLSVEDRAALLRYIEERNMES